MLLGSQNPNRRHSALSTPCPGDRVREPDHAVLHIFRRVHAFGRFALCLVTVFRGVRVLHISVPYLQKPAAQPWATEEQSTDGFTIVRVLEFVYVENCKCLVDFPLNRRAPRYSSEPTAPARRPYSTWSTGFASCSPAKPRSPT